MPPPARARRVDHTRRAGRGLGELTGRAARLHPDVRRGLLLDAAEALLAEHDPSTVTLEQVARTAGTSRPLVNAYFGDRGGLLDAVQVRLVRRLAAWTDHGLSRAEGPRSSLAALVEAVFSFVEQERDAWRLLSVTGGNDHPAMHALRARWAEEVSGGSATDELAAQACVAAVLLGAGGWVARGVEPAEVARVLARTFADPPAG